MQGDQDRFLCLYGLIAWSWDGCSDCSCSFATVALSHWPLTHRNWHRFSSLSTVSRTYFSRWLWNSATWLRISITSSWKLLCNPEKSTLRLTFILSQNTHLYAMLPTLCTCVCYEMTSLHVTLYEVRFINESSLKMKERKKLHCFGNKTSVNLFWTPHSTQHFMHTTILAQSTDTV